MRYDKMNTNTIDDILATKEQIDTSYIIYDVGDKSGQSKIIKNINGE